MPLTTFHIPIATCYFLLAALKHYFPEHLEQAGIAFLFCFRFVANALEESFLVQVVFFNYASETRLHDGQGHTQDTVDFVFGRAGLFGDEIAHRPALITKYVKELFFSLLGSEEATFLLISILLSLLGIFENQVTDLGITGREKVIIGMANPRILPTIVSSRFKTLPIRAVVAATTLDLLILA